MQVELIKQSDRDFAHWLDWANAMEKLSQCEKDMISAWLEYGKQKRLVDIGIKTKEEITSQRIAWIKSVKRFAAFKINNPGLIV